MYFYSLFTTVNIESRRVPVVAAAEEHEHMSHIYGYELRQAQSYYYMHRATRAKRAVTTTTAATASDLYYYCC